MSSIATRFTQWVVCFCALVLVAQIRAADNGQFNEKDASFVRDVNTDGKLEVDLGKLAFDKGSLDDVKQFGQHMADDHTKAGEELKMLAQTKNLDLTSSDQKEATEFQKKKDKLDKLSGVDFDKAYMKDMVKDHEDAVKKFEKAAEVTQDPELKTWAAKTLPTLQQHLQMAKDIQAKLEKQAG